MKLFGRAFALGLTATLSACGTSVRTAGPQAPSAIVASPDLAPAKRVFDIGSPVGSLAYDPATKSVWLTRSVGTGVVLDAVNETGLVSETTLPGDQLGGQSKVKLSPDGSVWITEDYRLLRYDPARGSASSVTLEEKAPGELPDAQNPSSPTPGTWVSAITFDQDGNALVARHNVAKLFTFSSSLGPLATVDVAPSTAGAAELAFDDRGVHGLSGVVGSGDQEVVLAPLASLRTRPGKEVNVMQAIRGDSTQVFARAPDGRSASVEDSQEGLAVTWGPVGAERRLAMPAQSFERLSPNGKTVVPVTTWTHPTVLLPTPDGALWFVADVNGTALFRIS